MAALIGFAPWILFWVFAGETFRFAAVGGFVSSLALSVPQLWHRRPKILEIGTLLFFAVLAVMAFTADRDWFERYANPLSNGALALIALVSMLVGRPFTLQYARETVPEQYWHEPHFVHKQYALTGAWCAAFVVQTVSTLLVAVWPVNHLVFRYLIPYGALVAVMAYTRWAEHQGQVAMREAGARAAPTA